MSLLGVRFVTSQVVIIWTGCFLLVNAFLGRVKLLAVDSETVEKLQPGQLPKDEIHLILSGEADKEHFKAAKALRV